MLFRSQEVVNKIAAFRPNQICLEYPIENQLEMDRIYHAYKVGQYALRDNERDLFGIQSAKKLGLKNLTCINYSFGKFDFDTVVNFAKQNNQQTYMDNKGFPIKSSFSLAIAKVHRNYRLSHQF